MLPDVKPVEVVVVEWTMVSHSQPQHEIFASQESAETYCDDLRRAAELLRTSFASPPVYYTVTVKR